MKKITLVSVVLLIMCFAAATQASTTYNITTFTKYLPSYSGDSDAFATQGKNIVVENFEDETLIPGFNITEIGGAGSIAFGVYQNTVDAEIPRYQVFSYGSAMWGFGSWFDLAGPGGPESQIDLFIDDNNQFVMTIPNTAAGEFYGFITDAPFTGVLFQAGTGTGAMESYALVDSAVCAVPVPIVPSAFLLSSGMIGLIGLRFRRKSI